MVTRREEEILALFRQEYASLHGLAYLVLKDGDLAEDIVMEAFLKAFSGWRHLTASYAPPAYLRQIVINLCRSRMRRQRIESRVYALMRGRREVDASMDSSESTRVDSRIDLIKALGELPERQRICVVLRYVEDLTESEIAKLMSCSLGAVKSQLSKARAKLALSLDVEVLGGDSL